MFKFLVSSWTGQQAYIVKDNIVSHFAMLGPTIDTTYNGGP